MTAPTTRKTILFVAEAATLAHLLRPMVLARALDPDRYDVHFACAPEAKQAYEFVFEGTQFTHWPIYSRPSREIIAATLEGKQLYSYAHLARYAAEDKALIERIRPERVIGDMRWTLPVVAKAMGVPCAMIPNAYWNPDATPRLLPAPEFPKVRRMVRLFGETLVQAIMMRALPLVMRPHLAPLNRVRREYGLPPAPEFFRAMNMADHLLYADTPAFCPVGAGPVPFTYLGAMLWQPSLPPPEWWDRIPLDRPIVYVALGSSGNHQLLPTILEVLRQRPVTVVAAAPAEYSSERCFAAPYFPYDAIASRSALMIGNGGSGFVYQALKAGAPGIGIVSNIDQLMMMAHAERHQVGTMIRSSEASATRIAQAVDGLLGNPTALQAIARLRPEVLAMDCSANFVRWLEQPLS